MSQQYRNCNDRFDDAVAAAIEAVRRDREALISLLREADVNVRDPGSVNCPFHIDTSPSARIELHKSGAFRFRCRAVLCNTCEDYFGVKAKLAGRQRKDEIRDFCREFRGGTSVAPYPSEMGMPPATIAGTPSEAPVVKPSKPQRFYESRAAWLRSFERGGRRVVADYSDGIRQPDGPTCVLKVRIEPGYNGKRKSFSFATLNVADGTVTSGAPGGSSLLYFNRAALAAVTNGGRLDHVFIVEGEGKADALAEHHGVPAVSPLSGAGALDGPNPPVDRIDLSEIAKAKATCWPDPDAIPFMTRLGQRARDEQGCVVTMLDPAKLGLSGKEDAVQWIERNPEATTDDLAAAAYELPTTNEPPVIEDKGGPAAAQANAYKAAVDAVAPDDESGTQDQPGDIVVSIPRDLPWTLANMAGGIAGELGETVDARHLFGAAWLVAATVGKRIGWRNQGADFYTNLVIVLLGDSGTNKTGCARELERCGAIANPDIDSPATYTMESLIERFGATINEKDRAARAAAIRDAKAAHRAERQGVAIVIDEFRAMMQQLIPAEQHVKNGQLFCRLTDNGDLTTGTVTRGDRVIGDCCFNVIGLSQTDPWNAEMRSATFQTGGVAARIIPVNSKLLKIDGFALPASALPTADAILRVAAAVKRCEECRVVPTFGSGVDSLHDAKLAMRKNPHVVAFIDTAGQAEWDLIESKALMQAAKLAVLLAVAELADGDAGDLHGPEPLGTLKLDAGRWLSFAHELVVGAHVSNSYHVAQITAEGQVLDRVVSQLKRGKTPKDRSQRALCRALNMNAAEAFKALRVLQDDGAIEPKKAGRQVYYDVVR